MKYAVITGSSRGIGAELAKSLARDGYSVAVCYNASAEKAKEVAETIALDDTFVVTVKMDLEDPDSVKDAFDYVRRCFPRVDLLVNNAAVDFIQPFEETSLTEWQKVINVNLTGIFLTCKEVCEGMREGGTIINVSSIWAKKGAACESAYSASKAGVEGFTRAFSKEYPMIKTYAVSLGYVDTDMNASLSEEDVSAFLAENPDVTRRSPVDVASAIISTITDESVISGSTVYLW